MNLDFYKCTDDPRKIDKEMTDKKTVSGVFAYENFSIFSPVFILSYDSAILEKQYFFSADLGRWYSIVDITLSPAGKMYVAGAVDVLKTYAANINEMKVNASRSESVGFNMVPDNAYPIIPGKESVTTLFLSDSDLDPPGELPPNQYRFLLTLKK